MIISERKLRKIIKDILIEASGKKIETNDQFIKRLGFSKESFEEWFNKINPGEKGSGLGARGYLYANPVHSIWGETEKALFKKSWNWFLQAMKLTEPKELLDYLDGFYLRNSSNNNRVGIDEKFMDMIYNLIIQYKEIKHDEYENLGYGRHSLSEILNHGISLHMFKRFVYFIEDKLKEAEKEAEKEMSEEKKSIGDIDVTNFRSNVINIEDMGDIDVTDFSDIEKVANRFKPEFMMDDEYDEDVYELWNAIINKLKNLIMNSDKHNKKSVEVLDKIYKEYPDLSFLK